ncbi:hypothetical protein [Clostridium psychrophilum]|uniref:hypothetical protein n=1 Tax=Clostridium psychrophilum TaxID=132926 RepID=UPI001C0E036F|nr:hypothetical protein [Clostridium psychrophilum]MBU3181238.1 hypothetical protein [Clostridium psychrophilum]
MKEGTYAVYNGKVYEAELWSELNKKGIIMLISNDDTDLNKGFVQYKTYGIIKKVRKDELTNAYYIQNFAKVQGIKVKVIGVEGDDISITSNDYNIFRKLNMKQFEPYVYIKLVKKKDIEEEFEEKKAIWGFSG